MSMSREYTIETLTFAGARSRRNGKIATPRNLVSLAATFPEPLSRPSKTLDGNPPAALIRENQHAALQFAKSTRPGTLFTPKVHPQEKCEFLRE
jgi:hypothetical protein